MRGTGALLFSHLGQVNSRLELHADLTQESVVDPLEQSHPLDDVLVQEEGQLPPQVAAHSPVVHQEDLVVVLFLVHPQIIVVRENCTRTKSEERRDELV